ncbi:GNAT family N-acetyltransferase [Duganella sp. FT80W]|uniref:GNAT family N-acetyltransferase n=1 Tax=Duganella guangzhouensis TaxID=2666084 RepID=A0A6I2L8I6_9BURK|nr:GNAT family N-acetyltransferase [Duganella guangzhouensis]MRW93164.1 GNAT family N-acetyltransferase [Duganella guangzhouensis]
MKIKGPFLAMGTERLVLAYPTLDDCAAVLEYRKLNRDHLSAWEPLRSEEFYTTSSVELQMHDLVAQIANGTVVHWLIKRHGSLEVIGQCGFTNIVYGPFQACHLGFSLGQRHQGSGLMFEALKTAIPSVFQTHGLHRIMANYQPENRRSEILLQRLGFEREGLAKSYLKINGRWSDHVLTSLINPRTIED